MIEPQVARSTPTDPVSGNRYRQALSVIVNSTASDVPRDFMTKETATANLQVVLNWVFEPKPDERRVLETKFQELAKEWSEETAPLSSVSRKSLHPAYQQIIGMGEAILPILLRQLEQQPDHWFWALKAITGADPVPESSRGKIGEMTEAWLEWARRRGLTW